MKEIVYCDKCGSQDIEIFEPEIKETPKMIKLSDWIAPNQTTAQNSAIFTRTIRAKCKKCNHYKDSITY